VECRCRLRGTGEEWRALDLAQVTARLSINDREIGSGVGRDVMGHH